MSSVKIGQSFDRDHATVLYGIKKFKDRLYNDLQLSISISYMIADIKATLQYLQTEKNIQKKSRCPYSLEPEYRPFEFASAYLMGQLGF